MKNRAIDIVFDNKHIDKADTPSGKDGFMQSLEDNILEPRIYDLIKEESRKHKTDSLMLTVVHWYLKRDWNRSLIKNLRNGDCSC